MQTLLDKVTSTRRGIMLAHKEPPYQDLNVISTDIESLDNSSVLLPLLLGLSNEKLDYIITEIKDIYSL